jgi:predicted NBD/HSP70 family sugar kinase
MTAQASRPGIPGRSAIGLDIGGTKVAGGVVTDDGTVLDLIEVPTPATGDVLETLESLRKVIDSLRDRLDVGVAIAQEQRAWSNGQAATSGGHPTTPTANYHCGSC